MNKEILHPEGLDNPWRRLPWILPSTFLIWGAVLWGLGLLLERITIQPEPPVAIDARILELPAPVRPAIAIKQPVRKVILKAPPPPQPAQVQRPSVQAPGKTPVTSGPAVSLPGIKSEPASAAKPFEGIAPVSRSNPAFQGSGETVSPPRFGAAYLNNPKPEYPAFARRMRMEGTVMLKVLVSSQGTTLKVEVLNSSGYEILDKAAVGSVKNWRFSPAKHGDTPVDEWVQVPVAFSLRK